MIDDDHVTTRLRSALDELTATSPAAPIVALQQRQTHRGRALLVAAASVALLGGGLWAIARRPPDRPVASVPPATTEPESLVTVTSTTDSTSPSMAPYFLSAADLVPGPVERRVWAIPEPGSIAEFVWVVDGNPAKGLLRARIGSVAPVADGPALDGFTGSAWFDAALVPRTIVWKRTDGAIWVIESYGLTDERMAALAQQIQPGSGVPLVLTDPSASAATIGIPGTGTSMSQPFMNERGAVTLALSNDVAAWSPLIGAIAGTVRPVQVAGNFGYVGTLVDGSSVVVWPTGDGRWGRLDIPAVFADRVDGLIAAVAVTHSNVPASDGPQVETNGYVPPITFGDQVMLGAQPQLASVGITVHAQPSRQAQDLIADVRSARLAGQIGGIVVIQVGTNGPLTADDLDAIIAELPPEATSIWFMTVHTDQQWIAPNNALILALPQRDARVAIIDWDALATQPEAGLCADQVHIACNGTGGQYYADLIERAITLPG